MTDSDAALPLLARYAIMVDVGYIYASAGELLFSAASRREYRVDADRLIAALIKQADEQVRGQLLRVYWYDAARDRVPTFDQRVIAQMPLVKLRLGNLNARGQQKGVDAQIRADMEALARHRAITDAILVAGDEDMVPAVEAAQAFGVRVHLWGVEPPYGTNQAERLVWESDTVEVLERGFIDPYFNPQPGSEAAPAAAHGALPARPEQAAAAAAAGIAVGHITAPSPAQLFGDRNLFRSHKANSALHASAGHLAASRLGPSRERVEEAGEHVAQKWILTRGEDNIRDLLPGPILPPVIDKELLVDAEKELGLSLRSYQEAREWLRDAFWSRVHRQFGVGVGKSRN
ncbi:MAG: NYN domain-containing protein [Streptosporangiaceae bacterium]